MVVRLLCLLACISALVEPSELPQNGTIIGLKESEKEAGDFGNGLIRSLLPHVVGVSGTSQLSPKCVSSMMKVFAGVRRLKGWTLKMLDSIGKPVSGILSGTPYSAGHYDSCLSIEVPDRNEVIRGQFCRIRIRPREAVIEAAKHYRQGRTNGTDLGKLKELIDLIPYIPLYDSHYLEHFMGLCLPTTCSTQDIQQLASIISFPGTIVLDGCEVKKNAEVDNLQVILICVFMLLIMLVCISTFTDWFILSKRSVKSIKLHDGDQVGRCWSAAGAFSLCRNSRALLLVDKDDLLYGQCVQGLTTLAVGWMVMGQTFLHPNPNNLVFSSLENLQSYWKSPWFSVVMSYPLATDILFVCHGFIMTYKLWHSTSKVQRVNIGILRLIVKNYLRYMIPVALLLGVAPLLTLVGSGPHWGDLMDGPVHNCRVNAEAYFGMYANLLDETEQCFQHLWFVPCLFQLTVIGIIICWLLSKSITMGTVVTILLCVGLNGIVMILTFKNALPPAQSSYFIERWSDYFWQVSVASPLSHFGPYAAGLLAGVLVARNDRHRSRAVTGLFGWAACITSVLFLLLAQHAWREGPANPFQEAIFAGIHRTVFGVCVAWVLVSGPFGVGGFVNSILSWKGFEPLFRLSFYAYLFHLVIITFMMGVSKEKISYFYVELVLRSMSYLGCTYIVSYAMSMLVQNPIRSLRAIFFSNSCRLDVTQRQKPNNPPENSEIEAQCKLWSVTKTSRIQTF